MAIGRALHGARYRDNAIETRLQQTKTLVTTPEPSSARRL